MKNKIIFSTVLILSAFFVFNKANADVAIHLDIEGPTGSIFNKDITVTSCDSDNNPSTPQDITAYCAVLQSGIPSTWDWYSWGVLLSSLNGISGYTTKDKDNNDVYHYWSWSLNSNVAMTGLNEYILQPGDSILVNFIDPTSNVIENFGGLPLNTPTFSLQNANSFLYDNQKKDGSFGDMLYTDWVAIAAGSSNFSFSQSIKDFLQNNSLDSSVITDNERHAMALMSLGIDPYLGTKINYIKKITDSFDGTQFGDKSVISDDIFALIILPKVGIDSNDNMIKEDISYVISQQLPNGSWGNVDMTSAAVQALNNFTNIVGTMDAISKGETYIKNSQNPDGGFGNSFSTSWALQGLSINETASQQITKADNYLAQAQQFDGGLDSLDNQITSRVWSTAYAIPGILHLSWNDILKSFPKPIVNESTNTQEITNIIPVISTNDIQINNNKILLTSDLKNKLNKIITKNKSANLNKTQINSLSANAINSTKNSTNNVVDTVKNKLKNIKNALFHFFSWF